MHTVQDFRRTFASMRIAEGVRCDVRFGIFHSAVHCPCECYIVENTSLQLISQALDPPVSEPVSNVSLVVSAIEVH